MALKTDALLIQLIQNGTAADHGQASPGFAVVAPSDNGPGDGPVQGWCNMSNLGSSAGQLSHILQTLERLSLHGLEGVSAEGSFRACCRFDLVPEILLMVELQPDLRIGSEGRVDFEAAFKIGLGSELFRMCNRPWLNWFGHLQKEAITLLDCQDSSPKAIFRYRRPTGELITIVGYQTTVKGLATTCVSVLVKPDSEALVIPWCELYSLQPHHPWIGLTPKGWDVLRARDQEQVRRGGDKDDVPDAEGFVRNPSDETVYRSAYKIIADYPAVAIDIKHLNKILAENPEIRRWKPRKNRLSVHLGDWQRYVDSKSEKTDDGWNDDPAEVEKAKAEVKKRKLPRTVEQIEKDIPL